MEVTQLLKGNVLDDKILFYYHEKIPESEQKAFVRMIKGKYRRIISLAYYIIKGNEERYLRSRRDPNLEDTDSCPCRINALVFEILQHDGFIKLEYDENGEIKQYKPLKPIPKDFFMDTRTAIRAVYSWFLSKENCCYKKQKDTVSENKNSEYLEIPHPSENLSAKLAGMWY